MKSKTTKSGFVGGRSSPFKVAVTAFALAAFSFSAQAGKITSGPSDTAPEGFGGWNLDNVEIMLDGTYFSDGSYEFDGLDYFYYGAVNDGDGTIMGHVLSKDWPIGEPPGIKVINDDLEVKKDKPPNCIMATSYLDDHFLDSGDPQQVTCSGPHKSHKRYKLAMLPSTVDGGGSESIDLVFNVEYEAGTRVYQVFQKINNWTDERLEGFTVQVGFGVGADFRTVEAAGGAALLNDLNIAVPSNLWSAGQLANFSVGLFGVDRHTGEVGFFDPEKRAGFFIDEYVDGVQPLTDTLTATTTLGSDYQDVPPGADADQFGPWLPNSMLPYGIFFDDDGNPETDAALLAWYGYNPAEDALTWMGGSQHERGAFATLYPSEISDMGANLSYTMGEIDDLVNVGLNYVVSVGNVLNFPDEMTSFTIRVTPTSDTSGAGAPDYAGADPVPALLFTSSEADVLLEPNPRFDVGALLTARVGDADRNQDPDKADEVEVEISMLQPGSSATDPETLILLEQGENRGVFAATLPDEYSNVPAGTVVRMMYLDEGTNEKISETLAVLEEEPVLTHVKITALEAPETIYDGKRRPIKITVMNGEDAEEAVSGWVRLSLNEGELMESYIDSLKPGKSRNFTYHGFVADLANPAVPETVYWRASVVLESAPDDIADEATASTQILIGKPGKNAK